MVLNKPTATCTYLYMYYTSIHVMLSVSLLSYLKSTYTISFMCKLINCIQLKISCQFYMNPICEVPIFQYPYQIKCTIKYCNTTPTRLKTCIMLYSQDGKTALDIAAEKSHKEIIEVLKTHQSKVRCTFIR